MLLLKIKSLRPGVHNMELHNRTTDHHQAPMVFLEKTLHWHQFDTMITLHRTMDLTSKGIVGGGITFFKKSWRCCSRCFLSFYPVELSFSVCLLCVQYSVSLFVTTIECQTEIKTCHRKSSVTDVVPFSHWEHCLVFWTRAQPMWILGPGNKTDYLTYSIWQLNYKLFNR